MQPGVPGIRSAAALLTVLVQIGSENRLALLEENELIFRYRIDASHSQGPVRSREARPQGCRFSRHMECGPVRQIRNPAYRRFLNPLSYLHRNPVATPSVRQFLPAVSVPILDIHSKGFIQFHGRLELAFFLHPSTAATTVGLPMAYNSIGSSR